MLLQRVHVICATVITTILACSRITASQAEGSVQLHGRNPHWRSRVEIFTEGQWGVVGIEGWGEKEARIACKQLGFGDIQEIVSISYFSPSPLLLITSVECGGWEVGIGECQWGEVVTQRGGQTMDIGGVICVDEFSVRLSGESRGGLSMVEVWSDGMWRGVCEEGEEEGRGWGKEEAIVTCRQLGYFGDDIITGTIVFGDEDRGLWQWRHNCSGSEHHLRSCNLQVMSHDHSNGSCDHVQLTNCNSGRAVGLSCRGIQSLPPQSLQLVNATCSTLTIEWVEPHTGNVHFIGYAIRIRSVNDRIGKWKYIESNTTNNTFIVHGLNASVLYEIQVGAVYNEVDGVSGVGMSGSGVEDTNIVYSDSLLATTPPTVPPPSVSVLLTLLDFSAMFQWKIIPIPSWRGLITGYTLHCTLDNSTTDNATVVRHLSARATLYKLQDLQPWTDYSCSISANTPEGEGPRSELVNFTTSLNVPSSPTDVEFTVFTVSDGTAAPLISITASWSVNECLNCTEPLGYIVTCCVPGSELTTTVWKSDIAGLDPIQVEITGVRPATRYVCKVAAFNMYGIGHSGSNIFVDTPETVPHTAPTEVYSSDIETGSIRLNWLYQESPSPGDVNTFKIEVYYKDKRYPNRNGEYVADIRYNVAEVDKTGATFSYLLMYLDPGTEYNVLIRAVTIAGEGPAARISQQTLSTVPAMIPYELTGSVLSFVYGEPPSFYFQWAVHSRDTHLLHDIAGFIITCSANKTTTTHNTANNAISISEPKFIDRIITDTENVFSASLYFPNTCDSNVDEVMMCSVSAFNEQGHGQQSESILIDIPCFSDPEDLLGNSFLTNPYFSLGLLAALILLVLGVLVAIAVLCVCNSSGMQKKRLSTSSSIDNYVPMASSESGIKSRWSDGHTSQVTVNDHVNDHAYDEIPADNLYDEIHPRASHVTLTQGVEEGAIYGGFGISNRPARSTRQQTTHITDPTTTAGLQTIPPGLSRSEARDSTITQYMELSSPLLRGDVTGAKNRRYSIADSGVHMTSSDVERSLNLDQSLHTDHSQGEGVQLRRYLYYTALSDGHQDTQEDANDNPHYTIMLPYSILAKNRDLLEQSMDTEILNDTSESGVGMSMSEVSNTSTRPKSAQSTEWNQPVVMSTPASTYRFKKRSVSGKARRNVSTGGKRERRGREGERAQGERSSKAATEDEEESEDGNKDIDKDKQ